MATLIGDFIGDHSRFHHTGVPTTGLSYQQEHPHEQSYRSTSHSRDAPSSRHHHSSSSTSGHHHRHTHHPAANTHSSRSVSREAPGAPTDCAPAASGHTHRPDAAAEYFPTPPYSSSPNSANSSRTQSQHAQGSAYMASTEPALIPSAASSASTLTVLPSSKPAFQAIPSPASDCPIWSPSVSNGQPATVAGGINTADTQKTVRVSDLAHVQALAGLEGSMGSDAGILNDSAMQDIKFDISAMPIGDVIEMVAALLTKITTTNDLQHDALNRNANHQRQAQAQSEGSESHASPFSTSVLAFHGKNVPAITILSYLSRIHKYCPTTYEVFLSLLVYFDRMTERVNELVMKDEQEWRKSQAERPATGGSADEDTPMENAGHDSDESDEDLADDDSDDDDDVGSGKGKGVETSQDRPPSASHEGGALPSATYFVVDSFNIHRLIIAGVTCASKFFSDVFYTNSRYAKVGGLPLAELNHLELQFLLLNDFRLAVPVEDLDAYATMLVEFYAREVLAHRPRPAAGSSSES